LTQCVHKINAQPIVKTTNNTHHLAPLQIMNTQQGSFPGSKRAVDRALNQYFTDRAGMETGAINLAHLAHHDGRHIDQR
jgi:hypothetical protein